MNWSQSQFWKTVFFPVFVLTGVVTSVSYSQEVYPSVNAVENSNAVVLSDGVTASYIETGEEDVQTANAVGELTRSPDYAYRQLVAGNARYLKDDSSQAQTLPRSSSNNDPYPIATILYSLDMPIFPSTLTQTTDHDVYMYGITAGAVTSDDLAAVEYGLLNLQTPLLVMMGHFPSRDVSQLIRKYESLESQAQKETAKITSTGVTEFQEQTPSNEMKMYNLVGPAIARSKEAYPDLQGYDLANVVSEALVWQSIETILMKSTVAQNLVRAGKLNVIAAIADDKTGKIYWLGEHPLQEEFLAPAPENLKNTTTQNPIIVQDDLPEALNETTIQEYVALYEANTYYNDVVDEYYAQPGYYTPSWELFSERAWVYRPWYGVWVEPFTPWPYWQPWGYPPGESGLGISIWNGRFNFFIGFNSYQGPYRPWNPDFRPRAPWWNMDIFVNPVGHWHDPIFDSVWNGRHEEIRRVPPMDRAWHNPSPTYRRSEAREPGARDRSPAPGVMTPDSGKAQGPKPPQVGDEYRPGDARPGLRGRIGGALGIGERLGGPGKGEAPRPGGISTKPDGQPRQGSNVKAPENGRPNAPGGRVFRPGPSFGPSENGRPQGTVPSNPANPGMRGGRPGGNGGLLRPGSHVADSEAAPNGTIPQDKPSGLAQVQPSSLSGRDRANSPRPSNLKIAEERAISTRPALDLSPNESANKKEPKLNNLSSFGQQTRMEPTGFQRPSAAPLDNSRLRADSSSIENRSGAHVSPLSELGAFKGTAQNPSSRLNSTAFTGRPNAKPERALSDLSVNRTPMGSALGERTTSSVLNHAFGGSPRASSPIPTPKTSPISSPAGPSLTRTPRTSSPIGPSLSGGRGTGAPAGSSLNRGPSPRPALGHGPGPAGPSPLGGPKH